MDKHALNFIIHSPFLTISSANKHNNHDTSPKGGNPGFVKVLNSKQLLIPDASGNNRIDGLINICENPSISLLFLIPGIDETLRINGKAIISNNEEHLIHFTKTDKRVKTCIVVTIEEVFLHCAKALMRSKLWNSDTFIDHNSFPTMGQMLKDQLNSKDTCESQDAMLERYKKDL